MTTDPEETTNLADPDEDDDGADNGVVEPDVPGDNHPSGTEVPDPDPAQPEDFEEGA